MSKDTKIRILFAGDNLGGVVPSGLGYIATSFMKRFYDMDKFEIGYVTLTGQDTDRNTLWIHGKKFAKDFENAKFYNAQILREDRVKNYDKYMEEFKPHVVISCADPWNCDAIAYSTFKSSYCWIPYLTVETPDYDENVMCPTVVLPILRKSLKEILGRAELVIPVTQLGIDMMKRFELPNCSPENVYNGIDFDTRFTGKVTKSEVFKGAVQDTDFLFMTMGRNTERKRIDLVVRAFDLFIKLQPEAERPKYKLYVHSNINEIGGGTDVGIMVHRFGLVKNVVFAQEVCANKPFDVQELYKRYAVSDCFIGLPGGEGYGLGYAEAMMHKVPLIYSNYGGHTTYCKDAGLPVKIAYYLGARSFHMNWGLADIEDAAKQMITMVQDKELREKLGQRGLEIARSELDWKVVFPKFYRYFDGAIRKFLEENRLLDFNFRRVI